jgi:hypothetical protein
MFVFDWRRFCVWTDTGRLCDEQKVLVAVADGAFVLPF